MNEFKGTTGDLQVRHDMGNATYDVFNKALGKKFLLAKCPYVVGIESDQQEAKSNAMLYSKAHLLLQKLDELAEELEFHQVSVSKAKEARELIKSAIEP